MNATPARTGKGMNMSHPINMTTALSRDNARAIVDACDRLLAGNPSVRLTRENVEAIRSLALNQTDDVVLLHVERTEERR
jgi:hypothetical protein